MKKIVPIILLILCIAFPATAFAPVAIPLWYWGASVALHVAGAAAGVYYAMKPSVKATVGPGNRIERPSGAVWVDLQAGLPALHEKNITTTVTDEIARSLSSKVNPDGSSKYPLAKDAYNKLDALTADSDFDNAPPNQMYPKDPSGKTVQTTAGFFRLPATPSSVGGEGGVCPPGPRVVTYGNRWISVCSERKDGSYTNHTTYQFNLGYNPPNVQPPIVPRNSAEANAQLTGSSSGTGTQVQGDPLQAELDKMMQDPDYVPVFTDDTTGLPYAPPASPLSPAQLDAANNAGLAADKRQAATDSRTGALASAGAATGAARERYTASGGNPATGAGGDPDLYGDYLREKAKEDRLKAEIAGEDADTAEDEVEEDDIGAVESGAGDKYGDDEERNFGTRFNQFVGAMKQSSFFGLPGQIMGDVPSGGSSSFSVSFGSYGSTTFDLAAYSSSFALIRFLYLFSVTLGCVKIITLKGGS